MRYLIHGLVAFMMIAMAVVPMIAVESESKMYENPNAGGYNWVDSYEPEPKIQPGFIEIKHDPNVEAYNTPSSSSLSLVNLPFNFDYYNVKYSAGHTIYVSTHGALSFVETSGTIFTSYNHIPSQSGPRGVLAVWWGRDYCYTRDSNRVYSLETVIDDEKVLIIEWNTQQGGTFEVILYEHGMIRYEYLSLPSWSWYTGTIGIESSDDQKGTEYAYSSSPTSYTLPFAIYFTSEEIEILGMEMYDANMVSLQDGDRIVYAGSQTYTVRAQITHTSGKNSILGAILTMAPHGEKIVMRWYRANSTWVTLEGFNKCRLIPEECEAVAVSNNGYTIDFKIDFDINYPMDKDDPYRNISVKALGKSAIPKEYEAEDVYVIGAELFFDDDLVVFNSRHRILEDNSYISGEEMVNFYGPKIIYLDPLNGRRSNVQPPPSLSWFDITETTTGTKVARIQSGDVLNIFWKTLNYNSIMRFKFNINGTNIPKDNILQVYDDDIYLPFYFKLQVDVNPPGKPTTDTVFIYADNTTSDPTDVDNDDKVIVAWGPAEDGESGLDPTEGYLIEAISEGVRRTWITPHDSHPFTVENNLLSYKIEDLPEGVSNISVRAVDLVGNIGDPIYGEVKIDFTGPTYELLSPEYGTWSITVRPTVLFGVKDSLSGVNGQSLMFRTSTNGGDDFTDYKICNFYEDGLEVEVPVTDAFFSEGTNNLIQIRGTDLASSYVTSSDQYTIWVDTRSPSISVDQPEMDDEGKTVEWLTDPGTGIHVSIHDFLGSGIDPTSITYKYSLDGGLKFSASIPVEAAPYNNSHGYEQMDLLIKKPWGEGDDNILLIEVYDKVGRYSNATYRIRMDKTPYVEITAPDLDEVFYDNMTVTFSCKVVDLDGNEDISVQWISSLDGVVGTSLTSEFILSEGEHFIILEVDDSVRIVRKTFSMTILSADLLLPHLRDTDGDGMNDSYEIAYGLDPERDDSKEDMDGDGHSNIEEYYAGTDPSDKNSYPGAGMEEEEFPLTLLILVLLFLLVSMVIGTLVVLEIKRSQRMNAAPILPPGGYYLPPQQDPTIAPGLPSLPPTSQPPGDQPREGSYDPPPQ